MIAFRSRSLLIHRNGWNLCALIRDMTRIFARGAGRERDDPAPISAGRDPISPGVGKTKSLARSLYALSPPRGNKRAFSLFTPPEIHGSYLQLQFSASLLSPSCTSSSSASSRSLSSFSRGRPQQIHRGTPPP